MALDVMTADDEWTINSSLVPIDRTLKFFGYNSVEEYERNCRDKEKFYSPQEPSLPKDLIP